MMPSTNLSVTSYDGTTRQECISEMTSLLWERMASHKMSSRLCERCSPPRVCEKILCRNQRTRHGDTLSRKRTFYVSLGPHFLEDIFQCTSSGYWKRFGKTQFGHSCVNDVCDRTTPRNENLPLESIVYLGYACERDLDYQKWMERDKTQSRSVQMGG